MNKDLDLSLSLSLHRNAGGGLVYYYCTVFESQSVISGRVPFIYRSCFGVALLEPS